MFPQLTRPYIYMCVSTVSLRLEIGSANGGGAPCRDNINYWKLKIICTKMASARNFVGKVVPVKGEENNYTKMRAFRSHFQVKIVWGDSENNCSFSPLLCRWKIFGLSLLPPKKTNGSSSASLPSLLSGVCDAKSAYGLRTGGRKRRKEAI